MIKEAVLLLLAMGLFFSNSTPTYATKWAESDREIFVDNSFLWIGGNPCRELRTVEEEFDMDRDWYHWVVYEGQPADFKDLSSEYNQRINEYLLLENEVGELYYENMILSLQIVFMNRFDSENEEYKNLLEEDLDAGIEIINGIHSRCNCNGR